MYSYGYKFEHFVLTLCTYIIMMEYNKITYTPGLPMNTCICGNSTIYRACLFVLDHLYRRKFNRFMDVDILCMTCNKTCALQIAIIPQGTQLRFVHMQFDFRYYSSYYIGMRL